MMEESGEQRITTISPVDALALRAIIQFYGLYLMKNTPSAALQKQMMTGQVLIVKLSTVQALVVTTEEVEHMKDAISIFIAEVERQIPETRSREGVLVSSQQLLAHLEIAFPQARD